MIEHLCKDCGKAFFRRSTLDTRCYKCLVKRANAKPQKPRKRIPQTGKESDRYYAWLIHVARPYLDKKKGRACDKCGRMPDVDEETGEMGWHDVDHIEKRGSHITKKYDVKNIRYLCRFPCHAEETDKLHWSRKP